MPAPKLLDLARRACIRNIRDIDTVFDLPYQVVRPILLKLENPKQLVKLEEQCPQIRGEDVEIWKMFICRDVDNGREKIKYLAPKNPESWGKLYNKLLKEAEAEEAADMAVLKEQLASAEREKMSNTATQVEGRNLPRIKGTNSWSVSARESAERNRPGPLALRSGSRTKMVNSKHIMEKARREAAQNSIFRSRNNALAVPTHLLSARSTAVKNVSQGMLEDHQRNQRQQASPPQVPKQAVNVRRVMPESQPTSSTEHTSSKAFLDREQRLRELTGGKKATTTATPSSTSSNQPPPSPVRVHTTMAASPTKSSPISTRPLQKVPSSNSNKRKLEDSSSDDLFDEPPPKIGKTTSTDTPSPQTANTTTTVPNVRILKSNPRVRTVKISHARNRNRSHSPAPASAPKDSTSEVTDKPQPAPPWGSKHLSISPPPSRTASPGMGMMLPRKKKPVDIFMPRKNVKKPEASRLV